jgi:class 3 adenylate cyclase
MSATGTGAGVLTFLIADVRGYTTYTQTRGDEAGARLAATFAEWARYVTGRAYATVCAS